VLSDSPNLRESGVTCAVCRRTAEIFLMDSDDYESIFAKYGINGLWDEAKHKAIIDNVKAVGMTEVANWLKGMAMFDANVRPLHHRRMSNNSVAFTEKPSRELLNLVFTMMQAEGEPK
jgi:ribonucleoside-triphosphate reductase (thioredoxin)